MYSTVTNYSTNKYIEYFGIAILSCIFVQCNIEFKQAQNLHVQYPKHNCKCLCADSQDSILVKAPPSMKITHVIASKRICPPSVYEYIVRIVVDTNKLIFGSGEKNVY